MIPAGLCQCGCGEPTPIATRTRTPTATRAGTVKGQPVRYIHGHNARRTPLEPPATQPRLCGCGCGGFAPIATKTSSRDGHIIGQPIRFITGHNARLGRKVADRPSCRCGCGQPVPLERTVGQPDKPRDYIRGHEPAPDARFVEAAAEIVMAVHDGGPDDFREQLADALALDVPDGVTAVEALVAALAALVDPDTRTATVTPVRAYLVALQETAGAA
jgi:hypothetical protein